MTRCDLLLMRNVNRFVMSNKAPDSLDEIGKTATIYCWAKVNLSAYYYYFPLIYVITKQRSNYSPHSTIHPNRWEGWGGGTLSSPTGEGVPHPAWQGGYPIQLDGGGEYPRVRVNGGTLCQAGLGTLWYPQSGYHPPPRGQRRTVSTCYATGGGMPLAFTQDFLVSRYFHFN